MLLAGVLFGSTFVLIKDAVKTAGPVPFLAARFLFGALVLAPFARPRHSPGIGRAALICAAALFTGYVFQTVGIQYTTSSVSAFITYLLVVIVPVIDSVTARSLPSPAVLVGVVLATVGLVLLTGHGLAFTKGEVLTLGCAVAYAFHIVLVGRFSARHPTVAFTALQLLFVGLAAAVVGVFTGGFDFPASAWLAAGYTGVVVSAIAFTLQVWGQRRVGPTRTSLLLMVEPVAAAGIGYVVGDRLGWIGAAGALLILVGILAAELPLLDRSVKWLGSS